MPMYRGTGGKKNIKEVVTMPLGDGTGPIGAGPRTGRKAGFCAGWRLPGFLNPLKGDWGNGTMTGRLLSGFRSERSLFHRGAGRAIRLRHIALPLLGGALMGAWSQREKIMRLLESTYQRRLIGKNNGGDESAER